MSAIRRLTKLALPSLLGSLLAMQTAAAAHVTLVVSGLGGNDDYQQKFDRYAASIAEQSRSLSQNPEDTILLPGSAATRDNILATLKDIMARGEASFALYLIGHGSHDGQQYKFNVPGPDITGTELQTALANDNGQRQFIVVATSASGALLETLDAADRILVTATKNGRERNAVLFPRFLSDAIGKITADTDKNEIISAEELFNYAEQAVSAHYENEKLLAPEHPRLQGDFAAEFVTARYGTLLTASEDIPAELLDKRNALSDQVNQLRARKDDLGEDDYFDQLQALMLELAGVQRDIDERSQ